MTRLSIVYASTTGHTEYVVQELGRLLPQASKRLRVTVRRAEGVTADTLLASADALLLACGTWNTGGIEGQLNPHMHALLRERAQKLDLHGLPCAVVGLGDHRYRYTAQAADHLKQYVESHGGALVVPPLRVVDEPYDRPEVWSMWVQDLALALDRSSLA
jgi:flavodoxin